MKCPRCQQNNPSHAKFCLECGAPVHRAGNDVASARPYADVLRELGQALGQQTATSEILRVISSSPTDVQPVFDAIAAAATKLCAVESAGVYRFDGRLIHLAGHYQWTAEHLDAIARVFPQAIDGRSVTAGAIRTRSVVHVPDISVDPEYGAGPIVDAGFRTVLSVPMLRGADPIGAITVTRLEVRPLTDRQIELLRTFADQAVIAIENERLLNELHASNRELTRTLRTQTATSDILRVINRSQTDVQPVFDAIVDSAVRMLEGYTGALTRIIGDHMELAALTSTDDIGDAALRALFPRSLGSEWPHAHAIRDRIPLNIEDAQIDPRVPEGGNAEARLRGYRSLVVVPMFRDELPVGTISVTRREPGGFSGGDIVLLQTLAIQAVIAIEDARLLTELQQKNEALTQAHAQISETLEQQTATSEILRVIASSPTDERPVFETIVASALQLLDGHSAGLRTLHGNELRMSAFTSTSASGDSALAQGPIAVVQVSSSVHFTRVVEGRMPAVVEDTETASGLMPPGGPSVARARGFRSVLTVPLLRGQTVLGVINVTRRAPGPFGVEEIALLQTFADQAVIAIENVRLFTELETRNRDLTEALDRQTATAEILRVISQSQTDVQPVFDTIAESAARLCESFDSAIWRRDGSRLRLVAHHGAIPQTGSETFLPVVRGSVGGRSVLDARTAHIADVQSEGDEFPDTSENARRQGYRTILSVPLVREGVAIGSIVQRRTEARRFSERQIALLQTFADQAVIAIENVRLFTELQEKNQALTTAHAQVSEALEQQTATAEILAVISGSPTDTQPVFDAIAERAARLTEADLGAVTILDGDLIHIVSIGDPDSPIARAFPMPPSRTGSLTARAVFDRELVHIEDVLASVDSEVAAQAAASGFRSVLAVPMVREGKALGCITVGRSEAGPYSERQITLLRTFAEQAVIAIENVRLFKELQVRTQDLTRSVEQLTALGEVGQAISSTLDLQTVLSTIVARATQLAGADAGIIYEYDAEREVFDPRATERLGPEIVEVLVTAPVRKGEGATGQLAISPEAVELPDILIESLPSLHHARGAFVRAGYRALLAVPLLREDQLIGGLTVVRKMPGEFPRETIELLQTFATQSALAIQNARLFLEIEHKGRQLALASQHKSEFLANMSHELRTPLNAILGFSEVLAEGMFGEINEKQAEYLRDILESGRHLLSLINDILDLSKIEAGRMELEPTDFDLPSAIDNALTLVRERAGRRGITLGRVVDQRVGMMRGDERKVKQVLLNLLSNAIKFTPEGGRIDVRASVADGTIEVSVADTGVGIAPEDQGKVFEEFRQVGTADKKVEGTGLGLALSRKFIELHGGQIWVKSQVGQGSTFTFTLPVRRGQ